MSWIDYLIVGLPLACILYMAYYSRRYIQGAASFLSADRLCGRYLISVADVINALSIMGLISYIEIHYKTGFSLAFWSMMSVPLSIMLSLTGYCYYRFRETRALSFGQFIEMRYSRKLRIFAAILRTLSEMLTNMIMPSIAARYFIYFLDLPMKLRIFGLEVQTFHLIIIFCLSMAIFIICCGGTLSLVMTDSIQGILCYPLLATFIIFVLVKFSWNDQIMPVMSDRIAGESFINPFDMYKMRDFNIFSMLVGWFAMIMHRASWIGGGNTMAAKSPHEQKMASMLGSVRGAASSVFYIVIALAIIVYMNHQDFHQEAHDLRMKIADRVAEDVVEDPAERNAVKEQMSQIQAPIHVIGQEPPLSQKNNLDTIYLKAAETALKDKPNGQYKYQQFRTLFNQVRLPFSMKKLLPRGLAGLFCLLLVLAMLSTDDTRMFSSALTITQDVILPLKKKPMTPKQHLMVIRLVSVGVGVFFFCGSSYMSQLDYISLFITSMCSIWQGGCGPVMIFGLYSSFGTTAGAWTSLLSGIVLSLGGIFCMRCWSNIIYPFLDSHNWVESVGNFLHTVSKPLNPIIVWEMSPNRCPINTYEFYFGTMIITLTLYVIVSKLTCKEPFNLDRMLHRGKYDLTGEKKLKKEKFTWKKLFHYFISITPEYTKGDKCIAWFLFFYSIAYRFFLVFILITLLNLFGVWQISWWSKYFLIIQLGVPCVIALVGTFWFGIGGILDFKQFIIDLNHRKSANHLDDGRVEGHLSLVDKSELEAKDVSKDKSN